jgi:hypothetical protein
MSLVRRYLRRGAVAWLACYALTFTALMPRDCCAAHAHGLESAGAPVDHAGHGMTAEQPSGHVHHGASAAAETGGASCPMPGPDGRPCPMHRNTTAAESGCVMTGSCSQPTAALAAVLMQAAVPGQPFALLPLDARLVAHRAADDQPLSLALPPDSPPPRL